MADPITAVGLGLAIVPLLISAFENYEVTFGPFVTYRRHVKEVQRFHAKLGAQRTIFLNECELLYTAVSNGTSWEEVIKNANHPSRDNEEISERLKALLGSSYETCVSTLDLINHTLEKICEETKGFQALVQAQNHTKGKSTLFLLRQKIKISFSKPRLNDTIDELRRHNEDLVTLSRQMRELSTGRAVPTLPYLASDKAIRHFQDVQKSSTKLHDILSTCWSCDERTEHIVSMCLNVEAAEKCHNKASKVCFTLVSTCIQQHSESRQQPFWLKVESAPGDRLASQVDIDEMAEDPTAVLQTKLRSVRFEVPSRTAALHKAEVGDTVSRDPADIPEPLLDLGTIRRLCRYVQRQQRNTSGEPCIGFLQKTKTFKHFVYPSPAPRTSTIVVKRCLKEILQKDFEERQREAWTEKLSLARLLALAVLRFQSTPWLSESWGSNDISFYSLNERAQEATSLTSPYLNIRLSNNTSSTIPGNAPLEYKSSSISPNPTLFSLGVVLLELGYDAPLQMLRNDDDLRGGGSNQFTDFFTATRLSKLVSKRLNLRFGKLVQKCLACNFGVGTELESPELQSAVVVNVVNELDECMKALNGCHSLLPSLGYPL